MAGAGTVAHGRVAFPLGEARQAATVEVTATAVDPKRSEAAKRGAITRRTNKAKAKRKPRTPVEAIEQLKTPAQVSPAVGYTR